VARGIGKGQSGGTTLALCGGLTARCSRWVSAGGADDIHGFAAALEGANNYARQPFPEDLLELCDVSGAKMTALLSAWRLRHRTYSQG